MRRKTVVFSNEPRYRRIGETYVIDSYCFRDICKVYAVRCGETSLQRCGITQNRHVRQSAICFRYGSDAGDGWWKKS